MKSTVLMWFLIVVIVLLIGCYLMVDDRSFNFLFKGSPTSTKADLLTIYMGVIGGIGVIFGLFLNNKKLEEQNRQNRIAEENRNDKRFTDAVNFLKDDSSGVVLSGVNTLFQIARQDKHYRQTVAILFADFLSIKQTKIRDRRIDETILNYLFFSSVFKTDHLILNDIDFSILPTISKAINGFDHLSFNNCRFRVLNSENVNRIDIQDSLIDTLLITNSLEVFIENSRLDSMSVIKSDTKFSKIWILNNKVKHLNIDAKEGIREISITLNEIFGSIDVRYSFIDKKAIGENNGTVNESQIKG